MTTHKPKTFTFTVKWGGITDEEIPVEVFFEWYPPETPIHIGFPYHGLELSVDKVREIRDTLTRAIEWYERKTK